MTHRSSGLNTGAGFKPTSSVEWDDSRSLDDWLKTQPTEEWKNFFTQNGYLVVENLISKEEIEKYADIYNQMLQGKIDTSAHRHDLGNLDAPKQKNVENICQIMWPSVYVDRLSEGPIHQRAAAVSKMILGEDMEFDFDMLISKAPHTDTKTPWHCDESYWLDLPDKRAVSCWCAIDDADADNGCMWFVPGSHTKPMRPHKPAKPGVHVLSCDASEDEGKPVPLKAGSCTLHHGRTLHYTRGNTTDRNRRAYITNFRPAAMVEYERTNNFSHGKEGVKGIVDKHKSTESDQPESTVYTAVGNW